VEDSFGHLLRTPVLSAIGLTLDEPEVNPAVFRCVLYSLARRGRSDCAPTS
jgi:hypothetical protein